MKIVVAVKQIAELDEELELAPDTRRIESEDLDWASNEWDQFSLEVALELREANGGEVVVVTVGGEPAEEGLLTCLAKGADRAVRVRDDLSGDSEPLAVARVLAEAVRREAPDLVLCGVQSSDAVNGATGVALAGLLDLKRIAVIKRLQYDASTGLLVVDRELEGGLVERLSIALPALLTVQTGINEPRYANLRAIKQAEAKPREVIGLAELGLEAADVQRAAGARVRRLARPDRAGHAEMLEGSPAEVAERVLEIVSSRVAS